MLTSNPIIQKFTDNLVTYSCNVQPNENVYILTVDIPSAVTISLIDSVKKAGAHPFVNTIDGRVSSFLTAQGTESQFKTLNDINMETYKKMDSFIVISGGDNAYGGYDIASETSKIRNKCLQPSLEYRVKKLKWCLSIWPSDGVAQRASMPTSEFEKFFFNVVTFDYSKMKPGSDKLAEWFNKTDKVHIKGPETDLRFSIKNVGSCICIGNYNIPDGEVFSAPVKDSVNGYITFNAPTVYQNKPFDNIRLEFKDGKIINATSSDTKSLNEILDSDEGSRYIGEFAIGFNPLITKPMRDILFDEKIAGSFHFTPGMCYDECPNGNESQVHWDMVSMQDSTNGGGEIWFDDVLIRKDGIFIPEDLHSLNPDQLLK